MKALVIHVMPESMLCLADNSDTSDQTVSSNGGVPALVCRAKSEGPWQHFGNCRIFM